MFLIPRLTGWSRCVCIDCNINSCQIHVCSVIEQHWALGANTFEYEWHEQLETSCDCWWGWWCVVTICSTPGSSSSTSWSLASIFQTHTASACSDQGPGSLCVRVWWFGSQLVCVCVCTGVSLVNVLILLKNECQAWEQHKRQKERMNECVHRRLGE